MTAQPKKILIIEDSHYMRKMLANLLTDAGFNVIGEAANGETGMNLVNTLRPNLVTLDIILPDMTGFEVLKAIKESNPDIPVVMVTGLGQEDVRAQAMNMGATAIITKPFDEVNIVAKLTNILAN